MDEVRGELDKEYGKNIDIGEIVKFKLTAKTFLKKFLELYHKYNHAKHDLKKVDKVAELNNLTSRNVLTTKLPSEALKRAQAKLQS